MMPGSPAHVREFLAPTGWRGGVFDRSANLPIGSGQALAPDR